MYKRLHRRSCFGAKVGYFLRSLLLLLLLSCSWHRPTMMESFVELLKERGSAPDAPTAFSFFLTSLDFIVEGQRISSFPYRRWHIRNRIQDWQADELKAAASNHKYVVFLFFFFCAATHGINCVLPKYQYEPSIVLLRFVTKCCWTIVSQVVLFKISAVLRGKGKPPLETTVKTTADWALTLWCSL